MIEERRAVVLMYEDLNTRHLRTAAKRIPKKNIELRVTAKHGISRATLYRYLKMHRSAGKDAGRGNS